MYSPQSPPLPPRLLAGSWRWLLVHGNDTTALNAPEVLALPTRLVSAESCREQLCVQGTHNALGDAILLDQVCIDFAALLIVLAMSLTIRGVLSKRVASADVAVHKVSERRDQRTYVSIGKHTHRMNQGRTLFQGNSGVGE